MFQSSGVTELGVEVGDGVTFGVTLGLGVGASTTGGAGVVDFGVFAFLLGVVIRGVVGFDTPGSAGTSGTAGVDDSGSGMGGSVDGLGPVSTGGILDSGVGEEDGSSSAQAAWLAPPKLNSKASPMATNNLIGAELIEQLQRL